MRGKLLLMAVALLVVLSTGVAALLLIDFGADGEAEKVARTADEVNAAIANRQFDVLHEMLSAEIRDTTGPQDLQSIFEEVESSLGAIVSVERVSAPVVEGETAIVQAKVTYDLNGERTTRAFYDLYIVENGEWRLVYSQPREEARPVPTLTVSE